MAEICQAIKSSEGIVLIYSQYIDGGVVPMALALEEMGLSRYSHGLQGRHRHLFKKAPCPAIDALEMKPRPEIADPASFQPAQYIMITGDKGLSPSNTEDVKYATNRDNVNGAKVKVIIISKAGSEGLDFKTIRQIHILEPWFNMNRIEQIIGRGVRNLSHCALPFPKRNVQIYLHATVIDGSEEEAADLYLYRLAEKKAVQIGKVTRLLKESAADCILNIGQTNFTATKLSALAANQNIRLQLSTKLDSDSSSSSVPREVDFQIGDLEGSELCDYMSCDFQCKPRLTKEHRSNLEEHASSSYTESNVESNMYYIIGRIKDLYREHHAYTLDQIRSAINAVRIYPIAQIYFVLSRFVKNRNMVLFDKFGRFGYLINRGKFYEFQPIEITDERVSIYERSVPVEYKRGNILLELPSTIKAVPREAVANPERLRRVGVTAQVNAASPADKKSASKEKKTSAFEPVSYKKTVRDIRSRLKMVETEQSIKSTEMNWYKNASHAVKHMEIVYGVSLTEFKRFVVFHYLDAAEYVTKRSLFESTFERSVFDVDPEIEKHIVEYFQNGIMRRADGQTGVFIADKDRAKLLILDSDTKTPGDTKTHSSKPRDLKPNGDAKPSASWKEGDKFDAADFKEAITSQYIKTKHLNRALL
jgi:hypothetical protein